jgi:hypothetical protein
LAVVLVTGSGTAVSCVIDGPGKYDTEAVPPTVMLFTVALAVRVAVPEPEGGVMYRP